jgi:hypothetical protein
MWLQRLSPRVLVAGSLLAFSTGAGAACTPPTDQSNCVCTEEFRFLIITVRDGSGQPVTGVSITVTQVRTGQVLAVQQGVPTAGTYVILDDSFKSQISSSAETIHVVGQKGTSSFAVDYSVQVDSCGCHVSKVSGPDSVTL